jgi:hypothetical protein
MIEWIEEQKQTNSQVMKHALNRLNARGVPVTPSRAQKLYSLTHKEQCILSLLRELVIFAPKEFTLSDKAEYGFQLLCDKRYRRTAEELAAEQ